jgi:ABC-type nitrate/sulfonate/bicarbonate transport system permease component
VILPAAVPTIFPGVRLERHFSSWRVEVGG